MASVCDRIVVACGRDAGSAAVVVRCSGSTYALAVDLALTRRGDYAVCAALCLGRLGDTGRYVKIREVAETMDLPASYTPQVLKLLADAGLAKAKAGRDGGYRLTRPSAQISLLEIVEAAEGTLALERCILRGGPCHWEQVCALHGAWSATVQASRDALQATTLADLVEADERLIAGRSADPEPTGHLGPRGRRQRPTKPAR